MANLQTHYNFKLDLQISLFFEEYDDPFKLSRQKIWSWPSKFKLNLVSSLIGGAVSAHLLRLRLCKWSVPEYYVK